MFRQTPMEKPSTPRASAPSHAASPMQKKAGHRSMELITNPADVIAPTETPDARDNEALRQEFMKTVAESLEHLPLRQRQVLTMRYYESRSLDEISELLDIREATVRTLLRHGVNNLRRHFKRSYITVD